MVITVFGYRLRNTDVFNLEAALDELRKLIQVQGKKMYTEMLASEIEMLCDDIALNVVKAPDCTIYDAARRALDQKVSYATGRGLSLPYNFGIQLAIYTHKDSIYIKVNANNEKLIKSLKRAPAPLEPFSIYEEQSDTKEAKNRAAVWNEIMQTYSQDKPAMFLNIFACQNADPTWKQISSKFSTRQERAEMRIRHSLTNQLINMLGGGNQIPPHKLMPYFDEALSYYDNDAIQADVRRMMPQTLQSIINITEELVKKDPRAPAPDTF